MVALTLGWSFCTETMQGTPFFMIPHFSMAISSTVFPRMSMWSMPMAAIPHAAGRGMILVLSIRPPIPTSMTAISTFSSLNACSDNKNIKRKKLLREEKVDIAVMEVGIGGRIDSTNIIPRPAACGIAAIGMDHMDILGNTVEEIAIEKCGIMKKGVPCMVSVQKLHPKVKATIEAESRRHEAPMVIVDPMILPNFRRWPALAMGGDHFKDNSYLALALARAAMEIPITLPIHKREADVLSRTVVEGRSQVVPLTKTMLANAIEHVRSSPIATPRTLQGDLSREDAARREVGEQTMSDFKKAMLSQQTEEEPVDVPTTADGLVDGPSSNGARLTFADPKECLNTSFYLDGAHNPESMQVMSRWFFKEQLVVEKQTPLIPEGRKVKNVLVIYSTRAPLDILKPLIPYADPVSYTHLRAHETPEHLVCRLLLEKKKKKTKHHITNRVTIIVHKPPLT
eukprot:TRINITY_DN9195_c0_g1_i16.p1 TRINITY_DN9195_c0_g1~~TRINITY_DN9195_c0_g1_i16.p1  ORF type:complete len:455 (+),score=100.33 TRINITY_DN9195_c0_g1_i16:124-1488(+)